MKKIIVSLFVLAIAQVTNAQIETPQPSPFQKIEQKVGLTDVTLEYYRPSTRGRTVMGDIVPYGKVWRTGANANTKITFSTPVIIGETTLEKGTYALYTIPNEKSWEVIFYSEANNWGNPQKWDDEKVAAKATATVDTMPFKAETFTITFDDLTNNSAVLGFIWENTMVSLPFKVPTDAIVSKNIEKAMQGVGAADYYAAAVYYLQAEKDIKQAQTWIDKAITMTSDSPKFWYLRQQALIHAKAGNTKGAIAAAKESLKLAEKAGNDGYVKMNTASLKEWGAL